MPDDTVANRLPDLREQLAQFNAHRASVLGGRPITTEERMPLERSGTGGDVDEDFTNA